MTRLITGTGSYLPERILTNQDLEKMVDTSDEWITSRTGIKERRIRLEILTLGDDFATTNFEFKVRGKDQIGRQSQTWVRFPDVGWKVIAAHVSTVSEDALW